MPVPASIEGRAGLALSSWPQTEAKGTSLSLAQKSAGHIEVIGINDRYFLQRGYRKLSIS
jgi:hypothetical protein